MSDLSFEFWQDLEIWSVDTFGPHSVRGPIGPLKHLQKEVEEALAEPDDLEEYVDCLFLIYDAAQRAGFGYYELITAAQDKLKKNKKRNWPDWRDKDPNIPIEHDRSNENKSESSNKNGDEE